ncbi:MAG: hypothetical protein RR131_10015, partial [Anaerovorax sp.]
MNSTELKKSTYMALVMVVVAAVSLAIATYAWFVNNTAVGVEQLEFSATGSTALSIAVHENKKGITATTNQNLLNYKGVLTNVDIQTYLNKLKTMDDGTTNTISGLKAVSTVSTAAFYANDGFNNEVKKAETFKVIADDDQNNYYLALPVWLRASEGMTVYLSDSTSVTVKDGKGTAKYFDRAILLGFSQVPGEKDGLETSSGTVIYEPNNKEDAEELPGRKTTTVGQDIDGYGISAINGKGVATFKQQDRKTKENLAITAPVGGGVPTKGGIAGIENKTGIVTLEKEIPKKMMIYLWLDGMDFDCV